ncbi:MAG: protein TolR [Stagnimonas sp.]|nr:protein TolR [Stagnimonas sp.]
MAVNMGNGRSGRRRLNAEINVVPYIDVMLVLLIIFMVTAPLLVQGVEVELPQASSEPMGVEDEPVTLSIDARGRYFLDIGTNTEKPLSDEEVVQRVGAVLRNKPQTSILIRGDTKVDYGRVLNGMALLQKGGASKLGFVTEPQDAGKPRRR